MSILYEPIELKKGIRSHWPQGSDSFSLRFFIFQICRADKYRGLGEERQERMASGHATTKGLP